LFPTDAPGRYVCTGLIERITFREEEGGYTVAKVKLRGREGLVTAVGHLMAPTPGEVITMTGEWTNHPRFGEQFKIISCTTSVPSTIYGIEKYLGSGLIKGIGPMLAKRIVKAFGDKTLDVLENEIQRVLSVEGIGTKRLAMIKAAWDEQREIRNVMIFLRSHGVSSAYAAKIFKRYGADSIRTVQENPYRLATDIQGIGFVTADRIAQKMGFPKDSPHRAKAGITYALNSLADEGHVYCPREELLTRCVELLDAERVLVETALTMLALEGEVVIEEAAGGGTGEEAVYLTHFHACEKGIAERIKALAAAPRGFREIDSEKALSWVESRLSIRLAEKQRDAVRTAARSKIMVITGGPGTGKTTIINAIIRIFERLGTTILLAAPTGRAAKRMSEATGFEAKTIHRLLKYSFQKGGFQKNEKDPLDCDILILDEASMIDTFLMYHLLKAVPMKATLILVGDINQLPSVGPGNVLGDIISSGIAPVVELTEIFRQASRSLIILNAHRINRGELPLKREKGFPLDDFYVIEQDDPETVSRTVVELVCDRIPKRFGLDPVEDIQVLSPMHRGAAGAANLNELLQAALNPGNEGVAWGTRKFRIKDKVMQTRNNYDKDVYNGDMGRVTHVDADARVLTVNFEGRDITYDFGELDEIMPAYAVSVHKSQGSEYPAVVIPLLTQHYMLLQRNLLYTAVTRGKKLVVLVGSRKALAIAVKNAKTQKRYTGLSARLKERGTENP
jgi:exodeoxyribonuclease V alpha subunit